MQIASSIGAVMIAATALLASSADAGRVRVSQEMDPGAENFVVKGFVKTFDRSGEPPEGMTAEEVYDYGGCASSYGGTVFLPEPDATVMAVVDTLDRRTLFTIHNFPAACRGGPAGSGGRASMSFVLDFDDSMECLVHDDPGDEANCGGATTTTSNIWLPDFTDGLVLGPLDDMWRLDASFSAPPVGIEQVIVRSGDGGDISGLATDRTVRFDNAMEVGVDVQPGADLGCLNSDGNGVIPVALLGGAEFDVTEIEISKLEFAGTSVRLRGNGQHQCSTEHVNGDSHLDLACHFYDDPDAWRPGAGKAQVTGELLDSTPFYGEDSICIRPPA